MKFLIRSTLAAPLILLASFTHSVETLSVKQLQSLCSNPGGDEACSFYLRGFLDGAVATDPRVTLNVARALEDESITERAYRTRLGPRMDRYGPSYFAEFCIGDTVPLEEVRDALRESISITRSVNQPARDFVYQLLRDRYACPNT